MKRNQTKCILFSFTYYQLNVRFNHLTSRSRSSPMYVRVRVCVCKHRDVHAPPMGMRSFCLVTPPLKIFITVTCGGDNISLVMASISAALPPLGREGKPTLAGLQRRQLVFRLKTKADKTHCHEGENGA